jgi:ABC-2 type transport system ATP-binding protein
MDEQAAIRVNKVSKVFKLPHEKSSSIKGLVVNFWRHNKKYESQQVLKNVSFEIKKGEFFGIVGRNGSGKSTLLKLLAGIYSPTEGELYINGGLTPFIELGVGFNPELTGRENVYLNGALLGFSRKEMQNMYQDIVEFAELKKFMDQKLKNYSSGMQVRLAFSIAIRAQNDILLLDEVLAVGDAAFQKKCYDYFMKLKKEKRTVVLVTHDMGAIRQYCDTALMINDGDVVIQGSPEKVAQSYQRLFSSELDKIDSDKENSMSWGTGKVMCSNISIEKEQENITIECDYLIKESIPAPIFGFTIYDSIGTNILEGNTQRLQFKTTDLNEGQTAFMKWHIPNIFKNGNYSVSVACCDQSAVEYYEWLNNAVLFKIDKKTHTAGIVDPELKIMNYKLKKG